jgi:hypothetical protein
MVLVLETYHGLQIPSMYTNALAFNAENSDKPTPLRSNNGPYHFYDTSLSES